MIRVCSGAEFERVASRQHQPYLAGYRIAHLANGGIKAPDPGINFSQLYLQRKF
jgi:hypothetical protein